MLCEVQHSSMMVCRPSACCGRVWKIPSTYALGTIFLDLWKDSATLWHRDDFLPICNVYFQPDIVNPVKKYQLSLKSCT